MSLRLSAFDYLQISGPDRCLGIHRGSRVGYESNVFLKGAIVGPDAELVLDTELV